MLGDHLAKETEACIQSQSTEAETEDAIEFELRERHAAHVVRHDYPETSALIGRSGLSKAHNILNEFACNLARAKGDSNLRACLYMRRDRFARVLDVNVCRRYIPLKAPMLNTSFNLARARRYHNLTRARVKDNSEFLAWRSH
jgi:hypothetical protein